MKVYLIRHAQSEENVLNLRQPTTVSEFNQMVYRSHTTPLTRWGRFQAQLTLGRLDGSLIEKIYTSPFDRAIHTATIIGNQIGIAPQVVTELREIQPRLLDETKSQEVSLRKLLFRSCVGMILPGGNGEKLLQSYRRAQRVWADLTSDIAQEIAIVSHYGLISLMLASLDRDWDWRIVCRDLSTGGVSVIVRKTK